MANPGRRKRRSYSTAFKRRVVAETMEPGASVADVARQHGLNANMVFQWRGDPRFGPGREAMSFLPVEVRDDPMPAPLEPVGGCEPARIEIALASGHRLIVSGGVDVDVILRLARGLCGP